MKIEKLIGREQKQIKEQLSKLGERLAVLDKAAVVLNGTGHVKRRMSAATRAKISKAQRARFSKQR